MMNINIKGNSNRVAGRDYVEYKQYEICPECEYRALVNNRSICKHCEQEFSEVLRQQTIIRRFNLIGNILIFIGLGMVVLSIWIKDYLPPAYSSYTAIGGLIGLLIAALGAKIHTS